MMPVKKLLLLFFALILSTLGFAQQPVLSTTSKAAIRLFQDGTKQYDSGNTEKAKSCLVQATEKDPAFIEAWTVLGEISAMQNDYQSAINYYETAIAINPSFYPNSTYKLGQLHLLTGDYSNAKKNFLQFLELVKNTPNKLQKNAEDYLQSCEFALNAIANPQPFNPVNLGKGVNSAMNEYYPTLTLNQKELVFTRDVKDTRSMEGHQEDFYISELKDTVWQAARSAGPPLNTSDNEGAPSISADGRVLFYTGCNRPDGMGSCDIYLSQRMADGTWSQPLNLGAPVNTGAWESQPSFSSDGRTLYFVRGTYDATHKLKQDIYYSVFGTDRHWSEPVRMSDTLNTPGREESVFIHPDNQTLYFSSDGHPGMGGLDIFLSRRKEDGTWGKPVNLGYPINTFNDENSLQVSADGRYAYFASDRAGGEGGLDMYRFELPLNSRATLVSYVKAVVTDAATSVPLAADFEIIDVESGKVVVANTTDKRKGEFLAALPSGKNYMLNVDKQGYLFYSDLFELKETQGKQKAFELKIALKKPVSGEKVVLKNIFFDVNKFDLKTESASEIEKLAAFLKSNPTVKIEVSGHTDSTGDKKANQLLSENRAKSVMNALVAKGISPDKISSKGYGDQVPVASNETEEGRGLNRRTEIKIL